MKIVILVAWLVCGFLAWALEDGYLVITHPAIRKESPDFKFMAFAFVFGPFALLATASILGVFKWTRRFWSKAKKDSWDMLIKLEQ